MSNTTSNYPRNQFLSGLNFLIIRCFKGIMMTHKRLFLLSVSVLLMFLIWGSFDNLAILSNYSFMIIKTISWDESRIDLKLKLAAEDEWALHKLNIKYYKAECTLADDNPKHAWITALNNDKYVVPTLVLGHLLDKLSCVRKKIALISDNVTPLGRAALESVGFELEVTGGMDCNYMDRVYNREISNKGIPGTHTRLLVFNLTRYDKVIYLDSDFFPTSPLDSLFEEIQPGKLIAAYCSGPSKVDPCFNAGLVGMVPDTHTHQQIMNLWTDMSATNCIDDQRLLWLYFAHQDNWIPLPYSFNVRRERYFPMRSYHFARSGKEPRPWEWTSRPPDGELLAYNRPMHTVMDIVALWWKYLLTVVKENELDEFFRSVEHLIT